MGNTFSSAWTFARQFDCREPRHEDWDSDEDPDAELTGIDVIIREGFEGKDFHKKYQMGTKLGEGTFSEVFKSKRRGSSLVLAVKRMEKTGMSQQARVNLFREVEVLRSVRHPNVINCYQFFDDNPKHYFIVLEYVKGGELLDRIVKKNHYSENDARDLCRILLGTVKYCHDQGIVHRDLKPENLLLASENDDHNVKLADFGFARSVKACLLREQCGTPNFVAPEIITNSLYGTSVDMWSTGVIIYILLGGYPPFHDGNQTRLFRKIKIACRPLPLQTSL